MFCHTLGHLPRSKLQKTVKKPVRKSEFRVRKGPSRKLGHRFGHKTLIFSAPRPRRKSIFSQIIALIYVYNLWKDGLPTWSTSWENQGFVIEAVTSFSGGKPISTDQRESIFKTRQMWRFRYTASITKPWFSQPPDHVGSPSFHRL